MEATVQLLKKVTLSLSTAIEPGKCDTSGSPVSLAFIYGSPVTDSVRLKSHSMINMKERN